MPFDSQTKVVVHFLDGKILKGSTIGFHPSREVFYLFPLGEEHAIKINILSVKALFFVKTFEGNKNHKKSKILEDYKLTPTQRKIKVHFKDGEVIFGSTHSYGPGRKGFFICPLDPLDNNERIYVNQLAVRELWLMDMEVKTPVRWRSGKYVLEEGKWKFVQGLENNN